MSFGKVYISVYFLHHDTAVGYSIWLFKLSYLSTWVCTITRQRSAALRKLGLGTARLLLGIELRGYTLSDEEETFYGITLRR